MKQARSLTGLGLYTYGMLFLAHDIGRGEAASAVIKSSAKLVLSISAICIRFINLRPKTVIPQIAVPTLDIGCYIYIYIYTI